MNALKLSADGSQNRAVIWKLRASWIGGESKHLDTGVYHCQQAAEKALKAFLAANGVIPPKTHDLLALLDLSAPFGQDFDTLRDAAVLLNPLGVQFLYPGDIFQPSEEEAIEALGCSENIHAFIVKRIPSDQTSAAAGE